MSNIYDVNKNSGATRDRKTIRWHIPKSATENVASDSVLRSGTLIGNKYVVPMYINPNQLNINYSKIINETLTKGGYLVQYWGEKNLTFSINGTTGSSGIEGIMILERIYRNEQFEYENILRNRLKKAKAEIRDAAVNAAADLNNISQSQKGTLTANIFQAGDGLETIMDIFSSEKSDAPERISSIDTHETLGALATQVEMHYDGLIHQGYFTSFSYTESATEPGLFSYSMNFTALKTSGSRDNFMAWHKSPFKNDELGFSSGNIRQSSIPKEGNDISKLSFPYSEFENEQFPRDISTIDNGPLSRFIEDQGGSLRLKPAKRR